MLRANPELVAIAMARACMDISSIAEKAKMPIPTVKNVTRGLNVMPKSLGKVAKALECDPTEIIDKSL